MKDAIRLAGTIAGAALSVVAVFAVGGLWGYLAGAVVFFACATIADRIWRRSATSEEIRRDLEDRARDSAP